MSETGDTGTHSRPRPAVISIGPSKMAWVAEAAGLAAHQREGPGRSAYRVADSGGSSEPASIRS
jgi:hypothetical protein